jgi:hypothetical protein
VSVHSQDNFSPGLSDRPVQSCGGNFLGIVDHSYRGESSFKFQQHTARAIDAHSIRDDNFHVDAAKVLPSKALEKSLNVPKFIPASDHHRNEHSSVFLHGHILSGEPPRD